MVNCRECKHIKRFEALMDGSCIEASCQHPTCFEETKYQNEYGEVKTYNKRVKDIIDLNCDGNCPYYENAGFHYKKVQKSLLGFSWESEIKVFN